MNNKISVIVPIYNAEKFLEKCLDSIVKQTYKNLEIILINDGSTDSSKNICIDYKRRDSRIVYIDNNNNGVSYSRNDGIKISTGKYITFIDADDYVSLTFIEDMIIEAQNDKYDLIISAYKEVYNNKINEEKIKNYSCLKDDLRNDYYKLLKFLKTPWGKLYKADIIKQHKIMFPEGFITSEDQIFNFKYFMYVKKYKFINRCNYFYIHQNSNSLSKLITYKAFKDNVKRLIIEKDFLMERNIIEKNKILSDDVVEIIKGYVFLDNENSYSKYKKRMEIIKKIIKGKYAFTSRKNYIILFCLKYNMLFFIYFYRLLKR